MEKLKEIDYTGRGHGSFTQEWGSHKRTSEWWYVTGYFHDELGRRYSYQFTILKPYLFMKSFYVLMLALTDFQTEKHYYYQAATPFSRNFTLTPQRVAYSDLAVATKGAEGITVEMKHKDFSLHLTLGYGKGAVWHCEDGFLRMGLDEPAESTIYFSYPNMPTAGTMTLNSKTHTISGKSWFDKQGGTFHLLNGATHWEWFSLRFFDDEEMMLFSFPQTNYQDGTYIRRDGSSSRLNQYQIEPLDFTLASGLKFSSAWSLKTPGIKEESYEIRPLMKGQVNLSYFEQLCDIINPSGEKVGLCFVELLPGVLNEKFGFKLFSKVE